MFTLHLPLAKSIINFSITSINMRQRGIAGPLRLHNETHSASWRHTVDPCDEIFFLSLCAVKCVTDCFLKKKKLLAIQATWGQSGASMFSSPFLPNLLIMALLFCHWHPEGISVCLLAVRKATWFGIFLSWQQFWGNWIQVSRYTTCSVYSHFRG